MSPCFLKVATLIFEKTVRFIIKLKQTFNYLYAQL